ncbi:bacillithiol system redox-active protein YtxJ [Gemmatimonas sp.]|uniref:bacillithiol system redox-active protein YtxJ n=1 Tax=Gemmatimonas sp. TaxID=1962908 RepID=UPI00333F875F
MSDSVFPAAVTDAEFTSQVLQSPVPVLVDVWASWCQPCVTLKPVMSKLAQSYRDRATVLTLDADSNLETVTKYDVRALPTVLLFDQGALIGRQSGAQALSTYTAMLDARLSARQAGVAAAPMATSTPKAAAPTVNSPAMRDARELVDRDTPVVIFKHSATCSISISVKREYDVFVRENPEAETRLLIVQNERPLSNALAELLRVQHESPQALVVRNGQVIWHASHQRITASRIVDALRTATTTA